MYAIKSFDGAYLSNNGTFDFDRYEIKLFSDETLAKNYAENKNIQIDNISNYIVYIENNDIYTNN